MSKEVEAAASYLFSPCSILGIPVFSSLGFPWKAVRNGELQLHLPDTFVVIFSCLSSSPYLAWIWCLCVHEVLQAPQGLPFPHHWRREVFDRVGGRRESWKEAEGGCTVGPGLAQHHLLLMRPNMSSLDSLCYNIRYKQSHITHGESLAGNQTHAHTQTHTYT